MFVLTTPINVVNSHCCGGYPSGTARNGRAILTTSPATTQARTETRTTGRRPQ